MYFLFYNCYSVSLADNWHILFWLGSSFPGLKTYLLISLLISQSLKVQVVSLLLRFYLECAPPFFACLAGI